MFRALKWLYPGMRVKRWIAVIFLGVFLSNLGAVALIFGLLAQEPVSASKWYGWAALCFLLGGVFLLTGVYRLMKSLGELLGKAPSGARARVADGGDKELVDIAFEQRYLSLGPRVVALGGGTGMSTLLEGLKEYTSRITAVVSVADDGGSSGRLRREFDMLPPGDIRKCLVALSDESPLLGKLMQYRFPEPDAAQAEPRNGATPDGSGREGPGAREPARVCQAEPLSNLTIGGHSFGNLFLTVLWRLTDDFAEAVRQAGRILSIRGRVIPATLDRVSLVATYEDGSKVVGQRQISIAAGNGKAPKRIRRVEIVPNPGPASREILDAIAAADLVVVGPGSLYTSVLPNLLIEGIADAVRRSGALKVYVANLASHEAETRGFSLKDHIDAIREHVGELPFDVVLVNSGSLPPSVERELASSGGRLVTYDPREFAGDGYGVRFAEADLVSRDSALRHDPRKLARTLVSLLAEERERA